MVMLAETRRTLNREFLRHGTRSSRVEDRHWFSLPVTDHPIKGWQAVRLPSSLRFKLRPHAADPECLVAMVFHMPCLPPAAMGPDLRTLERIWQEVHAFLDEQPTLRRAAGQDQP